MNADDLLGWYRGHARDLPWRRGADPFAVLVSEVMLQQTQVARVVPAYQAFLGRWPTPAALAAAPAAEVLRCWAGLGYPRRALALQRAAAAVVAEHGGALPDDLDALLALPGIGPYTARAVLAFGFGRVAAPVDTNIGRVLARAVAGSPLSRPAAQALADHLVPPGAPAAWSSALMDLGATVCTARRPRCDGCPLVDGCAWRTGPATQDPAAATATRSRPQGAYAGSDRYHRGRLLAALGRDALAVRALPAAAELPDGPRVKAVVEGLVSDGLASWDDGRLVLGA